MMLCIKIKNNVDKKIKIGKIILFSKETGFLELSSLISLSQ